MDRVRASRQWRWVVAVVLALALLLPATGRAAPAGQPAREQPAARRVGLQVGHWRIADLPDDQARLRGQTGGSGGGYREVEVNLAIAERTAALLRGQGITVDLLPAAVPRGYRADAFLAIHCDASSSPGPQGFKLARYRDSLIPMWDDALIAALVATYGEATALPRDDNITRAMTGYYAYNARLYHSIVGRQTPAAIIELGYLTNPRDRALLVGEQDRLADALADGILLFLQTVPLPPIPDGPAERRGPGYCCRAP